MSLSVRNSSDNWWIMQWETTPPTHWCFVHYNITLFSAIYFPFCITLPRLFDEKLMWHNIESKKLQIHNQEGPWSKNFGKSWSTLHVSEYSTADHCVDFIDIKLFQQRLNGHVRLFLGLVLVYRAGQWCNQIITACLKLSQAYSKVAFIDLVV